MKTNDPIIEQAGNIIDRQVGLMVRLVDDLLDIGRITKGKLRLTKEQVELRVVVNRCRRECPPLDGRTQARVLACRSLLSQFGWKQTRPEWSRSWSTCSTMRRNTPTSGGLVRMTVDQEAGEAVIRVRDNGVGIAPEMLPLIFELFTQVDGSLGRSYGGLGIGLALARNLVEMHEGRLQAFSAGLGKGCEFTIKLPVLPVPRRMKRRRFWSRATYRTLVCASWWWKITSMLPTA